ncbi:MAG: hypothetical protein IPK04_08600 [Bdellovibrionales bacterium]|nr:hypothetical protein [Bdellovibrionales bacterium]
MKSIVLFVLCCMVGVLGNAKSKAKIDVSDAFLTYAQFQALTPTERISYIKDVRQFVYNLTKENDFFAGSHQGKALYAMINLFQAEAWAETAGSVTVTNREGKEEPTLTATETDTSNRTQPSGQDPTKKDEGGWWGTQPPAPVVGGELRKVSPQPSVTEPEKPSESAAPTEQSNGGGGSQATTETTRQQPTSPTAISPAQALANKWAAEDMDPKKPCPGVRLAICRDLPTKTS